MILCTKCGAKLADNTHYCTFCNELIAPTAVSPALGKVGSAPAWVWTAYYLVSGYYVVSGLITVANVAIPLVNHGKSPNIFNDIVIIVGVLTTLFGAGLLARVEFVRAIMNFFCMVQILLGLIGIAISLLATSFMGVYGLIGMLLNVFQVATAAFLIYLIGETDKAPRF